MNRPQHPHPYYDRHLDCQAALEDYFNETMDEAFANGWAPEEAAAAIIDLADNFLLKLYADDEMIKKMLYSSLTPKSPG